MDSTFSERSITTHSKDLARDHEEVPAEARYRESRENETNNGDTSAQPSPSGQFDEEEFAAQQRSNREEEESLELARALMAEEAMASYATSMDYLRNNQDHFSQEDLAALQAAIDDEQDVHTNDDSEEDIDYGGGGMSYELMLQLGERLGDVKSERWAQGAQQIIESLPIIQFNPENSKGKDVNDCDINCLICQEEYCRGENLRQLPCSHCFHKKCVDQWLVAKDFCPYCRVSILEKE